MIGKPLPQPTLPNLSVEDDDVASITKRSAYGQDYYYTSDSKSIAPSYHTTSAGADYPDYPPMPAYNVTYPQAAYPLCNPSAPSLEENISYHVNDDYAGSNILPTAVPSTLYRHDTRLYNTYTTDVHGVYQGRTTPVNQPPMDSGVARDVQDYPGQYQAQTYSSHDYSHYGDPRRYQGQGGGYEYGHAL